jgi:hypothetical protein
MIFDTILARRRELFRRERQQDMIVPSRMAVTSDPELHPSDYFSPVTR